MALVADSFHMLSDIAALVIAFLSVRMAPKSWSKNTFGWARAEVINKNMPTSCKSFVIENEIGDNKRWKKLPKDHVLIIEETLIRSLCHM